MDESDDKKWIGIMKRESAGEPITEEERAFADRMSADRRALLAKEKSDLRVGDSARACFYRLKDERLKSFGPVMEALVAYQRKKRSSPEDQSLVDEEAEALFRGYGLLRWAMTTLSQDEHDDWALEVSEQCFNHMAPLASSVVRRWL